MNELYNKIEFKYAGTYKSEPKGNSLSSLTNNFIENKKSTMHIEEKQVKIDGNWNRVGKIGPGLENAGNTCFLNSVLQSLTYCPPLANYLLERHHSKACAKNFEKEKNTPFCILCAFEEHANRCFTSSKTILPLKIIKNLRTIAPRFRMGRQEDSHEFLRMLIDGMQKCSLLFRTKVDSKVQENSPIFQIFGGKLKSQVKCLACNYCSEIFETIYDLSLVCFFFINFETKHIKKFYLIGLERVRKS
jgi:ubiquitin C-terminal hydrolase